MSHIIIRRVLLIIYFLQDNFKKVLELAESLREGYKARLEEEVEKITNPAPVPLFRPPSDTPSILSSEAAEFVPSSAASYWGQASEAYLHHYDTNYYNDEHFNFYNYTNGGFPTREVAYYENYYGNQFQFGHQQEEEEMNDEEKISGKVWGNMLDILKS